MHNFIRITKALSDPTRVRILGLLLGGELCVCNIVEIMGLAQPTISRHLKQCTDADLTIGRKAGGWTHYRLATDSTDMYISTFLDLLQQAIKTDEEFTALQSNLLTLKKIKNIL
ncbi:metalloregulator ArsR/SmtB family transcription factor [Halodesulfovibrio sp. MK-HDV]|jgi:ArsR family transcriptional regulator, arsenate/arsenite/antimonite-responsive transcriptional repressor|uniref:ArsR/SmtB family transcription factor n=1 Tax=Halodesulfovibrio sp. MK-HDV TaxID=2599925 RepID=UPI00136DAC8B|nr:metalloregulator ArsR/SmtB family transcription factor [Halodesulfovibrio sp. MK-HDV]KAF1075182.1 Arsenic resistance transcriptional regulator ArsR1 [Halodesulfovibrio sp. MK-HDV]